MISKGWMATDGRAIAELDRITVRRARRTVLRDVSVAIHPGTLTVVVGADGSGRSTLLTILAGGRAPDEGCRRIPPPTAIGYVSQGPGVYGDLTVAENLSFAAAAHGLRGAARAERIRAVLQVTALGAACDRLAGRLSGGMRQKLAFGCAVLHDPVLLVLDEPTTGVDPISRAELWRLVSTQLARGAAAIVATSYPDEAERADQVVELDGGSPVVSGPPGREQVPAIAQRSGHRPGRPAVGGRPLLELRDLEVTFQDVRAVDAVSLSIAEGEIVGVLGANGAGKTTTIRAALGLERPSRGSIDLLGGPPSRHTRRDIGYVPQSLGLWQDLTPRQNLSFVAAAHGRQPPPLTPPLDESADRPVASLSLGHRRQLAFQAALSHDPRLLILDEPTSGVGTADRAALWDRIERARQHGVGALVTTHHLSEARHCDRIVVLMGGRVVMSGTLHELIADRMTVVVRTDHWAEAFTRLDATFAFVALTGREVRVPDATVAAVVRAVGDLPAAVSTAPASLDEVFVTLGRAA